MQNRDVFPIVGIFETPNQAQQAVQALQRAGFDDAQLLSVNSESGATNTAQKVNVNARGREQEARDILQRSGARVPQAADESIAYDEGNSTHTEYDPIYGAKQVASAPVRTEGPGLRRNPRVETQATAPKYDPSVRDSIAVDDGSNDSFFVNPVDPGVVEPGSQQDPNDRIPRVP